jgi:hypothetical protein
MISSGTGPKTFDDPTQLAEAIVEKVGKTIMLALPLGLGKANHIVNALYAKAVPLKGRGDCAEAISLCQISCGPVIADCPSPQWTAFSTHEVHHSMRPPQRAARPEPDEHTNIAMIAHLAVVSQGDNS